MPQEKITIKFEPKGDKDLINAINALTKAQAKLEGRVVKTGAANNQYRITQDKVNKSTLFGIRNNRLLGNAFATLRSKLLLTTFAMSMFIKPFTKMAKEAAKLKSVENAFNTLSGATENSSIAIEKLRSATDGTMSSFDLFKQANNAMILGVSNSSDEMAEMFDIAQRLGRALGQDTAMSVESLITGIGRQSRLMLDNIGIMVKAEEAYQAHADTLGVNTDQLTDAQKKQAFFNAAMKGAKDAISKLGVEQLSAQDRFDQFGATLDDFQAHIGEKVTPVVLGFLEGTAKFMKEMMETDLETAVRQMSELGVAVEKITSLQKLLTFETAAETIGNNISTIREELGGFAKHTVFSKEQLDALGVTLTMIPSKIKSMRQKYVVLEPLMIEQETVLKLMEDIEKEANTLALNYDGDSKDRITQLIDQHAGLNVVLQGLREIAKAQDILAGKTPERIKPKPEDDITGTAELSALDTKLAKLKETTAAQEEFNQAVSENADALTTNQNKLAGSTHQLQVNADWIAKNKSIIAESNSEIEKLNSTRDEMITLARKSALAEKHLNDFIADTNKIYDEKIAKEQKVIASSQILVDQSEEGNIERIKTIANIKEEIDKNNQLKESLREIAGINEMMAEFEPPKTFAEQAEAIINENEINALLLTEEEKQRIRDHFRELEKESNMQAIQEGLDISLAAIGGLLSAQQGKLDAEVAAMKAGEEFQNASSKKREAMETAMQKKQAGERNKIAEREKLASVAQATMSVYESVVAALGAKPYGAWNIALALGVGALGFAQVSAIASTPIPKFAQGGMIGGRRHSQGGTMINAEQGEFVMSRNAVESVGIENLNRMNQGGGSAVTVNVSGNVLSQDFVEGELAENIKEAIRRGTDFGIS